MTRLRLIALGMSLGALAACAATEPAPAPAAVAPPPAPPAPPAPAVEAPKKRTGKLGLPLPAMLKEEVGFDARQMKACREILTGYKTKIDEAAAKLKEATDRKAVNKEVAAPLRKEVLAKLREICVDDAQKAKFDQAVAPAKKNP